MLPCSVERNPTASLWFYFKVNCKQSCNVYHQIIPARANITEFCFPLKQERVFSQATCIKDYEKLQGANKQLSECSLLEISRSGVELRFCGKSTRGNCHQSLFKQVHVPAEDRKQKKSKNQVMKFHVLLFLRKILLKRLFLLPCFLLS